MKKWLIILFIILIVSNFTIADKGEEEIYKPRELFDLSIHLTNSDGEVLNASCNIQIRNENYSIILNNNMNEIGGGWYNYTYNTSKVGKYFCRYNCTKSGDYIAETCDFIIEGDSKMDIAIAIILSIFIIILGALCISFQNQVLKWLFGILDLGVIIITINVAKIMAEDGGANSNIVNMLNTAYFVSIYLLWIVIAIVMIYALWHSLIYLKNTSSYVRKKPNLDERRYNFKLR